MKMIQCHAHGLHCRYIGLVDEICFVVEDAQPSGFADLHKIICTYRKLHLFMRIGYIGP